MYRQPIAALIALTLLPALPAAPKELSKDQEALHALNRLTFGPRPGDVEHVKKLGLKKWIELQLHPEKLPVNPVLEAKLQPLESLRLEQKELTAKYPPPQLIAAVANGRAPLPDDPQQRELYQRLAARYKQRVAQQREGQSEPDKMASPQPDKNRRKLFALSSPEARRSVLANTAPRQVLVHDLWEAKLYRAIYSDRQLEEVLADFWFNHFNVFLNKGANRILTTGYDRDAIRPHVLGKFSKILRATAEHPAMLFYLDNWQSVSPASPAGRRSAGNRQRGLNENYARELLELHTLGVDGGYTQQDIINVARCFTGWTMTAPRLGGGFQFNPRMHDPGEKVVLGVKIPSGGGVEDGLKVLDLLSRHPSTAKFVSKKLAQRFVRDEPPVALVQQMAATFTRTDGDLREVMRTMLASKAFWSPEAYRAKIKSSLEMVASSVRATSADVTFAYGLAQKIAELGQPLYRKQEPTGYPNTSEDWVNSAALLARMNFALALTQNQLPGVEVNTAKLQGDPHEVATRLLFAEPTAQTRAAIEQGLAEKKDGLTLAGLILGSPEFQRR